MQQSNRSGDVAKLLSKPEMHEEWMKLYRNPDTERFFQLAYDRIVRELGAGTGDVILDAGCGTCAHSVRLVERGFRVVAADFSESALELARSKLASSPYRDRIELRREDLTRLSFPDASFRYVLCWGVLMHIPDVAAAVSELARVVQPGGKLVISEANESSPESGGMRFVRRVLGKQNADIRHTPAGTEHWTTRDGDSLVTRHADIRWLIRNLEARRMTLHRRLSGQLSETYTMTSSPAVRKVVHSMNEFWFKHLNVPQLAFGNILIFEKNP
jgi:ubiquinone/menaquinone biosynthesis C-methylase UbiE